MAALTLAYMAWKTLGLFEAFIGFCACVVYSVALPQIFAVFPSSFSFGEGCLVLQSVVIYTVHTSLSLLYTNDDLTSIKGSFDVIARICLLSVILLLCLPLTRISSCFKSSTFFLAFATAFFCALTYPLLWLKLKRNPVFWVLEYVLNRMDVLILLLAWAALVLAALIVVKRQKEKATTSVRKVFHLLVVLVAVSGLYVDAQFTCLASQLVLGIFVVLEFIRAFKIRPLSEYLNEAFNVFIDEKDQGFLILTNIYLLIGTFAPFWITTELTNTLTTSNGGPLVLSGVLAIGIGDSAASIIGSKLGRLKWPGGTGKTVEGTLASITSQLAFVIAMKWAQFPGFEAVEIFEILPQICLGSIIEALTLQVDNLVLPLTLYLMLSLTL